MKNHFLTFFLGVTTALLLSSCKHEPAPVVCDKTAFNYAADIKPIMDAHCTSCHTQGSLVSNGHIYLEDWAKLNDYVTTDPDRFVGSLDHDPSYHSMPKDAPKLTDCEISKIKSWIAAGALDN